MCFQVYFYVGLRLKGKWSIRQRQYFHYNSDGIIYPLPITQENLNWYDLSLISINYQRGRVKKGPQDSSFLAINVKEGESIRPKAKGPHHHFKIFKN
jgi:hypothetical protein